MNARPFRHRTDRRTKPTTEQVCPVCGRLVPIVEGDRLRTHRPVVDGLIQPNNCPGGGLTAENAKRLPKLQ